MDHTAAIFQIHFSKKLLSYDDRDPAEGPIVLHFKDDSTAECDLLVGADGIKSAVRAGMYRHMADAASRCGVSVEKVNKILSFVNPKWSGEMIYRGILPAESLRAESPDHPSLRSPCYVSWFNDTLALFYN